MDDIAIARTLHVLAVVHWIGGVALVTLVILPAIRSLVEPDRRLASFEAFEGRFATQARASVALAGLSGFYMTWRLDAWRLFIEPATWWMMSMLLVWVAFAVVLYVAEPLFLHAWLRRRAAHDPDAAFRMVQRAHYVLLAAASATVGGAVLGGHGALS